MIKIGKTLCYTIITLLSNYHYDYDYFIIINSVSPSPATTILTFPEGKPNWVLTN